MEIKRAVTNKRAVVLLFIFLAVFAVLVGRIAYIQLAKEVKGNDLVAMAEERYNQSEVLPSERGSILDRNASVLAEDVPAYHVLAVLSENQGEGNYIKDTEATAEQLAPYVQLEVDELASMLNKGKEEGRYQIELGPTSRYLPYETKEDIVELQLPGIQMEETTRRYYPKQTFASHVIGQQSVNEEINNIGLEGRLDEYLASEDGAIEYSRLGKVNSPAENITLPQDGADIQLTIDTRIQASMEQAMSQVELEYAPEKMTAIAADANTGEILAMSNRPSFNPNQYGQIENYLNYAVTDAVEPGSTLKMFTVAAAIEEGYFNDEQMFKSGNYEIDMNSKIHDVNPDGWGEITYEEGFHRSSNVLMSKLVLEDLGIEPFYQYLEAFGFSQPTGIDLDQESPGRLEKGRRLDAATTAFGQTSTMTPIQLIQGATAIANGGTMMKPYIVQEIRDEEGESLQQGESEVVGEPISAETAAHVRDLLRGVVTEEHGTGNKYNIQGLEVAGKTGTAQIAEQGGYLKGNGQYLYSFLGMAPYDDPDIVVYVSVTKPNLSSDQSGNDPVSTIFNAVMQSSMAYLDLEPNDEELQEEAEDQGFHMIEAIGERTSQATETLADKDVVVIGDGDTIEHQEPEAGTRLLEDETVILITNGDEKTIPDMSGWSRRDVLKMVHLLDLELDYSGSGYVVQQEPIAGTAIAEGDAVSVTLESTPPQEVDETEEETEASEEDASDE
ncbi:penicillin-binding protein [Alkalihalobacillus sp. LMS6]|uniref:penicillin-binding protein n=1 Tax=Alkalihalobacillus sp. LMS6 TaxID=2924034 RepID=UPI0020D0E0B4|nr:penicillin-binding protein [Alkalihalobacillus sp. LMS6]UTR04856.1 penicillin-binding protein [Alkalihalobacillus sp. LMS6]